jgi:surface antigen
VLRPADVAGRSTSGELTQHLGVQLADAYSRDDGDQKMAIESDQRRERTGMNKNVTTITVRAGYGLALATAMLALFAGTALARSSHTHHRRSPHGRGAGGVSCSHGTCFSGDPFYLEAGQCTWYAAGRRPDLDDVVHGNAGDWLTEARGRVPEGSTPVVGAIAVWLPNTGGAYGYGHVAYVAAASGASVTVEDFNWGLPHEMHNRHTVPASWISGYIYGGPAGSGPGAPAPPPSSPPPASPPPASPSAPSTPTPPPASPTPTPIATPPPSAPAAPAFYVYYVTGTCRDGACGLAMRAGPGYSDYAQVGSLAEGAAADVVCQALGETVSNGYAESAIWDQLTNGDWVSDFYLSTPNIGTWSPPIPRC